MSQEGFQEAMSGFYSAVASEDHKGACFMAVCRGKVSEGMCVLSLFAVVNNQNILINVYNVLSWEVDA